MYSDSGHRDLQQQLSNNTVLHPSLLIRFLKSLRRPSAPYIICHGQLIEVCTDLPLAQDPTKESGSYNEGQEGTPGLHNFSKTPASWGAADGSSSRQRTSSSDGQEVLIYDRRREVRSVSYVLAAYDLLNASLVVTSWIAGPAAGLDELHVDKNLAQASCVMGYTI
jgi:hypothetical protein